MGKTRNLFKKIRDAEGHYHVKMGTIKDRDGMDLTEAEDTKKRWQQYTEELYKKDLHDPDNHDGVITHLESDILECEVKWASVRCVQDRWHREGLWLQVFVEKNSYDLLFDYLQCTILVICWGK